MTPEQECEALAPFLDRARNGGILVVGQVRAELVYCPTNNWCYYLDSVMLAHVQNKPGCESFGC